MREKRFTLKYYVTLSKANVFLRMTVETRRTKR